MRGGTIAKKWIFQPMPEPDKVAALAQDIRVDPYIAALLLQKGITNFDQAKNYFRPSLADLHDPFTMKDMGKAVERLIQALANQDKILIYGDYDVDGVTSVALVYDFLRPYCKTHQFYVPDRYKEGYGVSKKAIEWAIETGITLIITLDCGIKAGEALLLARNAGIDVIVCDHHEADTVLPSAYAILDPKQPDCPYPYKELSGCGVGFKLLQGFLMRQGLPFTSLYSYLDLLAISIACDLVPITGENRILAYYGLQKINCETRPGVRAILQVAKMPILIEVSHLVFGLGPRLNAAGRIEQADLAIRLLLEQDLAHALLLAQELEQKNEHRKSLDKAITAEALQLIAADEASKTAKTTVLFKEDWHKGVIGIVASRCVEQYYRPTIILTASGGKAIGSARSVVGYNIYKAITACAELLDQYGGHAYAAGLTLPLENLAAFQQRFETVVADTISLEVLTPIQPINLELPLAKVKDSFYNIISQMAPFGNGNMKPIFVTYPLVATSVTVVKGDHLKLRVQQPEDEACLEAIGFGLASCAPWLRDGNPCKMVYTIERNYYLGNSTLQLNIKGLQQI